MQDLAYLLRLLDEVSHYNNGMTLHPEFLDTSQWLTEITSVYHHTVSAPFRFSSHIPQNLPCLHADPVKLRQAVSNLIRNGFESLKEEGEVTLDASADEQHLILCITDTGCGIPQEYIDTLFLPFVTHKSDGTGLGLSITRRIVEAHGGTIRLDTTPGKGTSFTILLPLG